MMTRKTITSTAVTLLIGLGLAIAIWLCLPYLLTRFHHLELMSIDARFAIRGVQPSSSQIVIIEIDRASLDKIGKWPWPRSYYADLVAILNQHGAKVIGFDIMFDSESSLGEQEDAVLSAAFAQHRNVVLASKRSVESGNGFKMVSWDLPIKPFRDFADTGFVNQFIDPDELVRQSWGFFTIGENRQRFSWDLMMLAHYDGVPTAQITLKSDRHIQVGKRAIPFEANGRIRINYQGPAHRFQMIPFYQVAEQRYPHMDVFKNKMVLIGATDPVLHDFFFTPFGEMSGVELHANVLQTLLENKMIRSVPLWANMGLTLLVLAPILYVSARARVMKALVGVAGVLMGYSAVAITAFIAGRVLIFWGTPMALGTGIYIVIAIIRYGFAEREKREMKSLFQQYVSPEVVETLLKDPKRLKLGGEKRELTVFFSDIRSFTTFSEAHTPEEIVDQLNDYLDAMTRVIFKWRGTLDKYVGDEIMAVWGAPLTQPNHASLALRCCWDQLAELRILQAQWTAAGKAVLDIGMGLNTGEMITGNIGSAQHKDYTVIGDAVNLGARLEAETRHHGTTAQPCYLIISEFTYAHVKSICKVKDLGEVTVKGKNNAVKIYEVVDVDMTAGPEDE